MFLVGNHHGCGRRPRLLPSQGDSVRGDIGASLPSLIALVASLI
jgi:hypothetical protein